MVRQTDSVSGSGGSIQRKLLMRSLHGSGRVDPGVITSGVLAPALRGWCERLGRPFDSVLKTDVTLPLIIADTRSAVADKLDRYVPTFVRQITTESIVAGTPDEVIAHYDPLVRAGLQHFLAMVYGSDIDTVRLLAERVVPELRDLQVSTVA